MRINSQVIHEVPPIDVALTRPILPWLARYFVGAGKPNLLLDTPQSTPSPNTNQLHNMPKSTVRRVEKEEGNAPKPSEVPKEEEKKPEETSSSTETPPAEPITEAPKDDEKKAEETSSEPPVEAVTEVPKEEGTEVAKDVKVPTQPFVIPPPNYYYDGLFKPIQGLPASSPIQAPFYNTPYVYYPAPYPAPLPARPIYPQNIPVTFPPMPSPKPVVNNIIYLSINSFSGFGSS